MKKEQIAKKMKLAGEKKVGDTIKFKKEGYEPFMPAGKYKVTEHSGKHPVVIDRSGHKIRLNKRADYE